ncbi:hypothetical protein Pan44_40370 [Caulifigura coniformis]|uniref:DUF5658 domain-containing protein n=2 Tax=Caulifigura coniformis TaxID=2527983 RepID=A0A517SIM6_9PLAN|nr:hypothetical protein Pan44_40370 [Caulifigura coniformis]
MNDMSDSPPRKNPVRSIYRLLTSHRPMEHETSLFLLVSFLDFLMTYWMIYPREHGPRFGESNAVANWFLSGWGIRGLLYFKVGICVFIVLSTQVIFLRRPQVARGILWLGIAVTALTVVYSGALYIRHAAPPIALE